MFDTSKEDLKNLLRSAHKGSLQLPDFQRDYVWGDDDVRSLIASVARGFPVGALLTLQTGGEVRFEARVLEGAPKTDTKPVELLLDGQQRITSLYQATFSTEPIRTLSSSDTEVERFYYIDMKLAVEPGSNFEEAIIGVPADRVARKNFGREIRLDLSTRENEFQNNMFPLNHIYSSMDWIYGWRDYWKRLDIDSDDLDKKFYYNVIERIDDYKMPVIRLDRDNSREAICLVFEKVNVGGKKLDAFELLTAIYAADKFDLREDWRGSPAITGSGRRARIIGAPNRRDVLTKVASIEFLQACALLHTRHRRLAKANEGLRGKELPQVSCRRDAVLSLPFCDYQKHADSVEKGFVEAASFLNENKIIWHKDVPYPPLIVGLAAIFAVLGNKAKSAAAKEKIARWFWSVTLGEQFGSSTETRLARDVTEVVDWIQGDGGQPRALDEAVFQQDRFRFLRTRNSAAYKGLHALLMRHGCRDFITGRPTDVMTFFNDRIDIHHVFPQAWCKSKPIEPTVFNSIVNKTPLSKDSNISIGGDAPSVYLKRIESKHGISPAQLDDILRTHLIEPEHLRNDNFDAFFASRLENLSTMVGDAMGKPVVRGLASNEPEKQVISNEDQGDETEAA